MDVRLLRNAIPSAFTSLKQVSAPVWQAGPTGFTLTSKVSLSQSAIISFTKKKLPEVSPLVHSLFFVLLKNVTFPSALVLESASSFMKPSISTLLVASSCIIAGISPSPLLKSNPSIILSLYNRMDIFWSRRYSFNSLIGTS